MTDDINADNYWERLKELEKGESERDAESINDSIQQTQKAARKEQDK